MFVKREPAARPATGVFDAVERVAKFVQNISVVAGIAVSGFALLYSQYEKRVDRTIEYKKDYDTQYRAKVSALSDEWDKATEADDAVFSKDNGVQRAVVLKFFGEEAHRVVLADVLDFYDGLSTCVEAHSCDVDACIQLFGDGVADLYQVSFYYIDMLRTKDRRPQIGRGLEHLYRLQRESAFQKLFPHL